MITKVFHVTITLIKYWYIDCVYYIIYKHILSIMQWYIFYYIKCNISQELLFQAECHFLLRVYINSAAAAKSRQSCPTLRPHRGQPTRLPCPWDSPGKNTGVGCHFLLQCMKAKSESEVAQSCLTLRDPMDSSPPGSSIHGIFQARVLEWGAIWLLFTFKKWYSPLDK